MSAERGERGDRGDRGNRDRGRGGVLRKKLRNAWKLWREGGVSAPYRAPFEVVMQDAVVALRRYGPPLSESPTPAATPILLVPPLMVTSEVYDISPELSAVAFLAAAGVPVYVADFGAPEEVQGGLDRTLDDHVLAVSRCVDHLGAVHLVGYSQGGMFCYQAAAYRKSAGVRSVVTFGSPVDIRRNVPIRLDSEIAERVVAAMRRVLARPLENLRGLPGTMSSRAFKMLAPLQEVRHLVQLFGVLHDDEALARIEPKRRFLGGEGFIAWPGPALRTFIDQFVVQNRMKHGGFVIAGRTVALADITSPILYLVGEHDDLALPDAVRAIARAAPNAPSYPVHVRAGHFGLVVGSAAMTVCWPTLLAWCAWHDGRGPRPEILDSAATSSEVSHDARGPTWWAPTAVWDQLGRYGVGLGRMADRLRVHLPRVVRRSLLEVATPDAPYSLSRLLRERARETPDGIAFLFAGRAFTFAEAEARVAAVARSLEARGLTHGERVVMPPLATPEALTTLLALNRLGAIAAPTHDLAAVDPRVASADGEAHIMDAVDTADRGASGDTALRFDARELSNRDWWLAGIDLSIDHRLGPNDTLFCPTTLSSDAMAVALAGALVGGARMQLADPARAWSALLNTGATIALADDELARALADLPLPERHPVRLVLGDRVSSEVAEALVDRLSRAGQTGRARSTRYAPMTVHAP